MPKSPKTICPGGCKRLVEAGTGRCPQHKAQQHQGTSKNRSGDPFYSTARWKRLRLAKLAKDPLCQCDACKSKGAVTPADRVDHIKPRCDYPELQWDWSNLRSMSEAHHNRHTAKQRSRQKAAT